VLVVALVVVVELVVVVALVVVVVDDDTTVVAPAVVVVTCPEVVPSTVSTTIWGAVTPVSRLAYRLAELSSDVRTRSTGPSPLTTRVTSTVVQVSPETGPETATTGPGVGAVSYVIVSSVQDPAATVRTV
jgi:hypothetical protein